MRFVLRMAWRETRAAWARLLFFFLCVGARRRRDRRPAQRRAERAARRSRAKRGALVGADIVVQIARGRGPTSSCSRLDGAAGDGPTCVDRTRARRDADDGGDAAGTGDAGWSSSSNCAASSRRFRSTAASSSRAAQPYSHALLAGPRRARAAGTARRRSDFGVATIRDWPGRPFTIRGVVATDRVQRGGGHRVRSAHLRRSRRSAARRRCSGSAVARRIRCSCASDDA